MWLNSKVLRYTWHMVSLLYDKTTGDYCDGNRTNKPDTHSENRIYYRILSKERQIGV